MRRHDCYGRFFALLCGLFMLSSCALPDMFEQAAETSRTLSNGVAVYYPSHRDEQPQRIFTQTTRDDTATIQRTTETLAYHVDNSLIEARAHVEAAEARLNERKIIEAVREYERAQLILAQQVEPSLAHLSQSSVQGGMSIISTSQIQAIEGERRDLNDRINAGQDSIGGSVGRTGDNENVEKLRERNRFTLMPIAQAEQYSGGTRVIPQMRPQTQPSAPETRPSTIFDMSYAMSEDVERNIARLQSHDEFTRCLGRMNQYFPQVASILRSYGVPEELAYIALLESGFQPQARSASGRAGLWQLSKTFARQYGLRVTAAHDERHDVYASTAAFARYISSLYQKSGSWPFAVMQLSPQRDYLAKLIAAITIANNPQTYGVNAPSFSGDSTTQSVYSAYPPTTRPASSVMVEPPVF